MGLAVWIVSGLLAFAMFGAGMMKITTPRTKLMEKMKWAATWTDTNVKLLGLAEVLGAVGLIVPVATGIVPVLTPVAALCLAVLMAGGVKTHLDLKESPAPPAVLLVLCLFVAAARFGLVPT